MCLAVSGVWAPAAATAAAAHAVMMRLRNTPTGMPLLFIAPFFPLALRSGSPWTDQRQAMATKLRDQRQARQQSCVTGGFSVNRHGRMRTFVPRCHFKQEKADVEIGPLCSAAGEARQGEGSRGFSALRRTPGQRR